MTKGLRTCDVCNEPEQRYGQLCSFCQEPDPAEAVIDSDDIEEEMCSFESLKDTPFSEMVATDEEN